MENVGHGFGVKLQVLLWSWWGLWLSINIRTWHDQAISLGLRGNGLSKFKMEPLAPSMVPQQRDRTWKMPMLTLVKFLFRILTEFNYNFLAVKGPSFQTKMWWVFVFFQQHLEYPQFTNYPVALVVNYHFLAVVVLVPHSMRLSLLKKKNKACCPTATKRMGRLEQARHIPQYSLLSKKLGFVLICHYFLWSFNQYGM